MPTKAQARRAGISERQRLATHRNALSRGAQRNTGSNYQTVARIARKRTGGKIATVSRSRGTVTGAGMRKGGRRR